MLGLQSLLLVAIAFQIVLGQPPNVPPECRGPPPDVENPHECCKIPPMFADEDLEACGIPKLGERPQGEERFRGPPNCSKQKCILKKYNLMKDDDIDYDALSDFLDKWAEKNSAFKSAVETAKTRCSGDLPGPPQICEADKVVFCIGTTMFVECPTWGDSDNCKKLKEHLETCKAAFPKPL